MSGIPCILTRTPMTPTQKHFVQSPLSEAFLTALRERIGLYGTAAYLRPNGPDRLILYLYADRGASHARWHPYMDERWLAEEAEDIRAIFFGILAEQGVSMPAEAVDNLPVCLIDLRCWQQYWSTHTR